MNSGRETISFRYLVISEGTVLFCSDDKEQVESYIQGKVANQVAVYQLRYKPESALMTVEYEDELYLTSKDKGEGV